MEEAFTKKLINQASPYPGICLEFWVGGNVAIGAVRLTHQKLKVSKKTQQSGRRKHKKKKEEKFSSNPNLKVWLGSIDPKDSLQPSRCQRHHQHKVRGYCSAREHIGVRGVPFEHLCKHSGEFVVGKVIKVPRTRKIL